jgi:hypothetical protein
MKLISILKEIKVNQPLNKRKAFEDMLNFDEAMLTHLVQSNTLDEFIGNYGYDSLEDMLADDFGISDTEYTTKINNYYNAIKPGDVTLIGENITSIAGYKNAVELLRDSGDRCSDHYFVALKF